ncbi:MAG: DUF4838 domain-containing protein [Dehalococcoidia bacterium]
MRLTAECLAGWTIEAGSSDPVSRHAADELRTHLALPPAGCSGTIRLEAGGGPADGFEAHVEDARVTLRGQSPRGLVNAVAWLLEQAGFAWVEPGPRGVCRVEGQAISPGRHREAPAFARRTLILGQDAFHDDWRDWMTWASRNRYNDIFFHDTPPSRYGRTGRRPSSAEELAADGGCWLFERWREDGPDIVAFARERGMRLQFGGHHLGTLLPRALFDDHPGWFPVREGQRDPRHNLCVSAAGALAQIREAAARFVGEFAGADVYHFWADDIRGGGWCSCDGCRSLSPSDQALIATNAAAEGVATAAPGTAVAHLAYHDTLRPPASAAPAENVVGLFAPRERCYAHAIDDGRCDRNWERFWKPYQGLLRTFGHDPGRVAVFEYYSDSILFKGLAPPLLTTLPGDARAYASTARNLQNLMVSDRPWVGPPWHAWWFARAAWDALAWPDEALDTFCRAAFPATAQAVAGYYEALDAAFALLLDLHDFEDAPHHDVLDFSDVPRPTLRAKAIEAGEAVRVLRSAAAALDGLEGKSADETARITNEREQARVIVAVATHLAERLAAWDAALSGDDEGANGHLERSSAALEAIEEWDAAHSTPAFAVITTRMRQAMRSHLERIRELVP